MSTGYFFVGSKSVGLMIEAFNFVPSSAVTVTNSTGDNLYSASSGTLPSLTTATRVPSMRYRSWRAGVAALEYVSTNAEASGAILAEWDPASLVMRVRDLSLSETRYSCVSRTSSLFDMKYR